ncbi:HutD family protein [Bdellovibrio sp. NC01]|uniref:HutD/Ves family protein n=1 Tax=Bdellovibrio sp. NC01 TaxID=2220073 RepID=UPI0011592837|nr:HutD family protein [Bdellovibrio sp. NC01]QDK38417.1 hypothetical protein DOE51_12945 [Bdellovibrio sp. NC01]
MLELISQNTYQVMPWKNGQGTTSQIAIEPPGTAFPDGDYLWRLSSAIVKADNSFSQFPGYNRLLSVWQGQGLRINHQDLLKSAILAFHGEEPIHAELIQGDVMDIGIIFKRGRVQADMKVLTVLPNQTQSIPLEQKIHFLFCAEGSFKAEAHTIAHGDTLKVTDQNVITITGGSGATKIYLIGLSAR